MKENINQEIKSKEIYNDFSKELIKSLDKIHADIKVKNATDNDCKIISNLN